LPPSAYCQLLRGWKSTGDFDYDDILKLARDARGQDRFGYRDVFLTLVNLAKSLDGGNNQAAR
jgi:Ca-activated chloride channel homolog